MNVIETNDIHMMVCCCSSSFCVEDHESHGMRNETFVLLLFAGAETKKFLCYSANISCAHGFEIEKLFPIRNKLHRPLLLGSTHTSAGFYRLSGKFMVLAFQL